MATSSSSAPTAAAAAAAPEAKDGPVLSVVSKRLRALRKKYNRITQTEVSLAAGKTINCDQEKLLFSKTVVAALIEELEGQVSMVVVTPQPREAAEESLAVEGHKPPDGQSDGVSKSSESKEDVQGDDGEEPTIEVPLGHRRVQLLAVHANFAVSTIDIYDWHRVQTIYVSRNHQKVGEDLMLTGPRRPIGAYGTIGIEVYPLGSDDCITQNLDPYFSNKDEDEDEDEDEPKLCVQRIDGGSSRMVDVTYLFIPNTIEAEIKVELLPDQVLDAYGRGVVSGTVKARVSDYGRYRVILFSNFTKPRLIVRPGIGFTLPLKPSVVCFPYRPYLPLYIEVDLLVVYGKQKASRITSNLKFFPRDFGKLAEEVQDHRIEVSVHMHPDPLG
ncbi:unnamed protein product [Urochloa humidicola]